MSQDKAEKTWAQIVDEEDEADELRQLGLVTKASEEEEAPVLQGRGGQAARTPGAQATAAFKVPSRYADIVLTPAEIEFERKQALLRSKGKKR